MDQKKRDPIRVRMLALIADLEPIKKIKKGEGGAIYSHYAHNDVQQAVMSLLPKHAIFMNTTPVFEADGVTLTMHARFEDAYNPEDVITTSTPVKIGSIKDEKGSGAAMSYALKYTLMRIFGLGGEDDVDTKSNPPEKLMSREQVGQIVSIVKDDAELKETILNFYKVDSFSKINEKYFPIIMRRLSLKKLDQLEQK